jgi:hypothetical protein
VASLSRPLRLEIARRRLLRVLARHGVATMRTLEQKISDAGPAHMRIDPHLLTVARKLLQEEKFIARVGVWYHLRDAPPETIRSRLADQQPTYLALQKRQFRLRQGQTLEIAVSRALGEAFPRDHLGGFAISMTTTTVRSTKRKSRPIDWETVISVAIGALIS